MNSRILLAYVLLPHVSTQARYLISWLLKGDIRFAFPPWLYSLCCSTIINANRQSRDDATCVPQSVQACEQKTQLYSIDTRGVAKIYGPIHLHFSIPHSYRQLQIPCQACGIELNKLKYSGLACVTFTCHTSRTSLRFTRTSQPCNYHLHQQQLARPKLKLQYHGTT